MEKIAVQCETESQYGKVLEKAYSKGWSWSHQVKLEYAEKWDSDYPYLGLSLLNKPDKLVRLEKNDPDDYTIISASEYLNEGGKDVSEFKKGDRVECVDSERSTYLEKGEMYTIERLSIDCENMFLEGLKSGYDNKRFKLVHVITDKTQTIKENNMELNSSIRTVLVEEDKADYDIVEKMQSVFGDEIKEDFTGAMTLRNNKDEYLAEIKRLDDNEAKRLKEEAKKDK